MKMVLVFSHKLTEKQIEDAREKLNIDEFVELPKELKDLWSQVPADADFGQVKDYLIPIKQWLAPQIDDGGDFVLLAGESSAFLILTKWLDEQTKANIVVSTTQRTCVEKHLPDGKVEKQFIFEHVRYRRINTRHNF